MLGTKSGVGGHVTNSGEDEGADFLGNTVLRRFLEEESIPVIDFHPYLSLVSQSPCSF